nr:probable LRR receptor-like serine/threonine-protein kinase At3g47570 [Ipomoea batatas]
MDIAAKEGGMDMTTKERGDGMEGGGRISKEEWRLRKEGDGYKKRLWVEDFKESLDKIVMEWSLAQGESSLVEIEARFHGTIPISFPNASKLQIFEVSQNHFVGKVPDNIGKLKDLFYLNLESNLLGTHHDENLAFMHSLSNCSNLQTFSITRNKLQGIKDLASLTALILTGNLLSGRIPSEIDHNNLDGNIPSNVGNFLILYQFYLSNNKFNGTIPEQIFELPSLSEILDLSSNSFTGPLPITVEYGIGGNSSIRGDVYSYGIFLLEMFTAKRPTYDFSGDGYSSLCEYVEAALLDDVMRIVDPLLLACQESNHEIRSREHLDNPGKLVEIEEHKMDDFFISVFKIWLTCASRSPMDRAPMKDVTTELHKIRNAFFV